MLSNHKLAQSIADCGLDEFKRQLIYKAEKFGSKIILADRWFPSSKTCSSCGHIQDMPLSERIYSCGSCGHSIDRDLNAAINLSRQALRVNGESGAVLGSAQVKQPANPKGHARDSRSHAPCEVISKMSIFVYILYSRLPPRCTSV